jgi:hypothetical protein
MASSPLLKKEPRGCFIRMLSCDRNILRDTLPTRREANCHDEEHQELYREKPLHTILCLKSYFERRDFSRQGSDKKWVG